MESILFSIAAKLQIYNNTLPSNHSVFIGVNDRAIEKIATEIVKQHMKGKDFFHAKIYKIMEKMKAPGGTLYSNQLKYNKEQKEDFLFITRDK